MNEEQRQESIGNIISRLGAGFKQTLGEGREDHRAALQRSYDMEGKDLGANRVNHMLGSNRTLTALADAMGTSSPSAREARQDMGLGWSKDPIERKGQALGIVASDIVQDRMREMWWLINAAQAVGTVGQEAALKAVAPDLYKQDPQYIDQQGNLTTSDELGNTPLKSRAMAVDKGLAYERDGRVFSKANVSIGKDGQYQKTRNRKGMIDLLNIPVGVAINSGVGLMNPLGGQEGYKAVFESEDDPSKTSNVLGEVAAKYILGRTGNLLPWDEFKQVRPDVSKDEYMRYKAFKFEKDADLDITDGDLTVPTGVLKYTNEGIHGPEVQFLGRSLPIATAIMPAMAAVGSTAYGARRGGVKGGLIGGALGTGASMLLGNVIEGERRRRNAEENKIDTIN